MDSPISPTDPASAAGPTDPADALAQTPSRLHISPIISGVIFLAFCAWITQRTFFPDALSPAIWLTSVAIGVGVLLLGAGIVALVRNSNSQK